MEKKLNIKQMIFSEFLRLELIEQAIEYAKEAELSEDDQYEALINNTNIAKKFKKESWK